MNDIRVTTADQVDSHTLDAFLRTGFQSNKADFLRDHASWWYGGGKNSWVISVKGDIAGYCAIIPARIWLGAQEMPAIWWVDLIMAPKFRRLGYQSLFDEMIKKNAGIKLGFPNKIAANIHKKHQWRIREDIKIRLCPLVPSRVPAMRRFSGPLNVFIRFFLICLTPFFHAYIGHAANTYKPRHAYYLKDVDPCLLAGVFDRNKQPEVVTTIRDSAYFQWRYLDAPYFNELVFYLAGSPSAPSHYLIARHLPAREGRPPVTRVLDLFGDFGDQAAITSLLNLVKKDAFQRNSVQVTVMLTRPELKWPTIRAGFWLSSKSRFCWIAPSHAQMQALGSRVYWVLGDSDNDPPD